MMPIPGPTNQIGRIVGWPSADVDVTEFAVSPAMLEVVVAKVPVSIAVCGPKVIIPLEVVVGSAEVVGAVLVVGPPSSVGANPFSGYTEFEIL